MCGSPLDARDHISTARRAALNLQKSTCPTVTVTTTKTCYIAPCGMTFPSTTLSNRLRKKMTAGSDSSWISKNFCKVRFRIGGTVLELAKKTACFRCSAFPQAGEQTNFAKRIAIRRANIRRTKQYTTNSLEKPANFSKSDGKWSTHRRHHNFAATQLLNGCSDLDEIL